MREKINQVSIVMDIYSCEECDKAFAVEEDEEPKVCSSCESELWEYSHTVVGVSN